MRTPTRHDAPEPTFDTRADRVRVVCHCGRLAGVVTLADLYAPTRARSVPGSTLKAVRLAPAPRLRCRNGHEPRPGRKRLIELYDAATNRTIRL